METKIPRLLFAAPKSGSGKTLVTCGFLEAVKRRGILPVSFKCGPDYIDPMFHKYVLGISGTNMDSFFLEEEGVRELLVKRFSPVGKEEESGRLAVMEGVMGYYDGLGGSSMKGSTYELARITQTPVILVLDCKGASVSLAATAAGFLNYQKDSYIAGVVLNRVSPVVYERLVPLFEERGLRVYGYLPEKTEFSLESRHLGLMMPEEFPALREKIEAVADQMEKTVDLDGMLSLAGSAAAVKYSGTIQTGSAAKKERYAPLFSGPVRIGVARDEAFSFYYQENLQLMEECGAELVYFSPIHDAGLPESLSGILLGGGYPENFAKELSENKSMLSDIKRVCTEGMPVLSECGGFLYLHRTLEAADGEQYSMAGVVDASAFRTNCLNRFGYITLTASDGQQIKGHEFHYWESSDPGDCCLAEKPVGERSWRCIHQSGNLFCGFPHLYYPSNPEFIKKWLGKCMRYAQNNTLDKLTGEGLENMLNDIINRIEKPDEHARKQAEYRWSKVAKPLLSLGLLEDQISQIAAVFGSADVHIDKKALVIMCADNGIVEEGVTQTGQEVTAVVTANITRGDSCACLMAERAGADVFPVDMGVALEPEELGEKHPLLSRSIRRGTGNFLKEQALTRQETVRAVLTGISIVEELKKAGYELIATGEMGIGNTTTSSAVASVLLDMPPEQVTGKGAGLTDSGLLRKIQVIGQGIELHRPDKSDGIDVLSKVGGLDLAGMAGLYLGGAVFHVPVLIDGFISAAAAAAAAAICGTVKEYMLASHVSAEPAGMLLLKHLGKMPVIQAGMCLGEGTGAVALMPLLDMAVTVYLEMSTFSEIEIEDYKAL